MIKTVSRFGAGPSWVTSVLLARKTLSDDGESHPNHAAPELGTTKCELVPRAPRLPHGGPVHIRLGLHGVAGPLHLPSVAVVLGDQCLGLGVGGRCWMVLDDAILENPHPVLRQSNRRLAHRLRGTGDRGHLRSEGHRAVRALAGKQLMQLGPE